MRFYKTIDSTQTEAKRLIDAQILFNNDYILAEKMTSGVTTKKDIPWYSPKGNLYLTIVLKNNDNFKAEHLLFCSGLAIFDYLKKFNLKCTFKWPNDILVQNKNNRYCKISGIIAENYKNFIIIGIGLNLVKSPKKTHNFPATNIKKELNFRKKIFFKAKIIEISNEIMTIFDQYKQKLTIYGFDTIKKQWKNHAFCLNGVVSFVNRAEKMIFEDISDDGYMICKDQNGQLKTIDNDEIIHSVV